MNTQFEDVPMAREHRQIVDRIATELLTKEPETRQEAAAIINAHGMAAYVGGHHVAIHHKDSTGAIRGARLALVTHDAPDWQ